MSFGFRVTNTNNSILVDENNPVYYVPRYTISQSAPTAIRYGEWDQTITVLLHIVFDYPVNSIEQPYLFMTQNVPPGIPHTNGHLLWTWQYSGRINKWMNNISWSCSGTPGNWTGMTVKLDHRWTLQDAWMFPVSAEINNPLDWRHLFVPVANGGTPPRGYGICVFGPTGKVVYNSNDNMVSITSKSNTWIMYNQYELAGGEYYLRIFYSPALPTSYDDLLRVIPKQVTRRAEGSTGEVTLYQVNPRVERAFLFGRWDQGGVEAETPVIWVRPVQPRIYTAI